MGESGVGVGGVEVGLVAMRPAHCRAQVVGDDEFGDAAEKLQRAHVGGTPVGQSLRPGGLGIGVARRPEHGHEHLRLAQLPALAVHDGRRVAGVVDEQLLAGAVRLAHDHIDPLAEGAVALAELAVLNPIGMLGLVLLPQQRQGDPLAPQLGVNVRPIRHRTLRRRRHTGAREQPRFERPLIHPLGQWPTQPRHLGAAQVIAHRRRRDSKGAGDGPNRQPGLEEQPQGGVNLAHG